MDRQVDMSGSETLEAFGARRNKYDINIALSSKFLS